jgi:hypothetical protein
MLRPCTWDFDPLPMVVWRPFVRMVVGVWVWCKYYVVMGLIYHILIIMGRGCNKISKFPKNL